MNQVSQFQPLHRPSLTPTMLCSCELIKTAQMKQLVHDRPDLVQMVVTAMVTSQSAKKQKQAAVSQLSLQTRFNIGLLAPALVAGSRSAQLHSVKAQPRHSTAQQTAGISIYDHPPFEGEDTGIGARGCVVFTPVMT